MKTFGNRKFYSLPDNYGEKEKEIRAKKGEDTEKLIRYIDDNVIGKDTTFCGPYGQRKVVYCDYTASGRSLQFIEDFILQEVLPCYGNTHTTTSTTSLQTTLFRHEARDIFRNAVNASEHDAVIFAGHGCTGAVHKLVHALQLAEPPVVFVGPCEHHSNLLPWREVGATVVRIGESKEGFLDLEALEQQLQAHSGLGRQLIGCFSAASNITGLLADDVATTLLLHQYGALAFWDYAAAAPYVRLDMNPLLHGVEEKAVHKDAMFFSVHKFIGGVQTPGILIAKKSLFRNSVPNGCGGGTVFFVTRDDHRYLQDVELREEGGTAAIVESVRAGLAMQLKESVGVTNIMTREEHITKMVLSHIKNVPELLLLGSTCQSAPRLPIFSFLVRHPRGTFLHHNFICTVLNDVFGIQARGGCACAGPYAQDLLGIDPSLARQYEHVLLEDSRLDRTHLRRREEHSSYEMLRPGFARISLPFFMTDDEVGFVLEALKMVALEGWKLLPQYILNPETGEWRHRSNLVFKDRRWLGSVSYEGGKMNIAEPKKSLVDNLPQSFSEVLQIARNTFNKARKMALRYQMADQRILFDENTEKIRWFMLPIEAEDLLLGNSQKVKHDVPFDPVTYEGSRASPVPPPGSPPKLNVTQDPELDFMVGGSVDPSNLLFAPSLALGLGLGQPRSLNSPTALSPMPSLALLTLGERQRHCSCSSQTDLNTIGRDSLSLAPLTTQQSQSSEQGSGAQTPEEVQAYVKEVTKELATEIKSEIREVISQVQDVLDDSEMMGEGAMERPRSNSLSLRSAQEVAEYLVEASQRLANEVKSELREVVTAVDVLISDEGTEGKRCSTPPCLSAVSRSSAFLSSPELCRRIPSRPKLASSSSSSPALLVVSPLSSPCSDEPSRQHETKFSSECESDETVIHIPAPEQQSEDTGTGDESPELDKDSPTDEEPEPEPPLRRPSRQQVTSVSSQVQSTEVATLRNQSLSQDSGINISFQERAPCEHPETKEFSLSKSQVLEESPVDEKPAAKLNREKPCSQGTCSLARKDQNKEVNGGVIVTKAKWHCPPRQIWKPAVEALQEFEMIRDGDRVMVCLSGGKDSLSLLHTLHQFQFYARAKGISFTIGAATVDPGSTAYDPRPLIPYLQALDVPYFYEEQQILQKAASLPECTSVCSFCSRMKRGRLYAVARREGYNVLALGQHLDDLGESFLMSVFHNGRLRTMKAHYSVKERDLRIIRPLVYVREKALRQFAESKKLPIIPENCPACFEAPKERHRTKQLLAQQEILFPRLFWSLRAAMHPLMSVRRTGVESRLFSRQRRTQDLSDSEEEEERAPV